MRAFIWDLDGTLLDSYGVITSSAVDTLKDFGIAADPDSLLRRMKNDSLTVFLRETAGENRIPYEKLIGRYREITHERDDLITLTDRAAETLRRIRENGGTNYVYTHRGASAFRILERLGIREEFADIVTHEDGFRPKPSGDGVRELIRRHGLNPQSTCYIGDRPMDIFCARDAGVTAVLYLPEDGCVEPTGQEDLIVQDLMQLAETDEIIVRATKENADEVLGLYRAQIGREYCNWDENYPGPDTIEYDLSRDSLFVMKDRDGRIIAAISAEKDEDVDRLDCWTPELQPGGEFARGGHAGVPEQGDREETGPVYRGGPAEARLQEHSHPGAQGQRQGPARVRFFRLPPGRGMLHVQPSFFMLRKGTGLRC